MKKSSSPRLRDVDARILRLVMDYSPLSISEIARLIGSSRSWAWKRVAKLQSMGLVAVEKRGGVVLVRPSAAHRGIIRIGVLRASEYPYIIPLYKMLRDVLGNVEILVYDDAFTLATHLAGGKVHLAMAPAITLLAMHRLSAGRIAVIGGGSSGGAGIIYSRSGGAGHVTTMASTMELCAEYKGLRGPRRYASSGSEILNTVLAGRAAAGVVWEPYIYLARLKGLEWESCDLPFCCLLGANRDIEDYFEKVRDAFSKAVDMASRGRVDLEAYSRILSLDAGLVKATISSYEFLYEPPVEELRSFLDLMRTTILPSGVIDGAVWT